MSLKIIIGKESEGKYAKNLCSFIRVEARRKKMLAWDLATIEDSICAGHSLLAFMDDKLAGHVCVAEWRNYTEICALIVDEKYRRHGIGTRLLKEAVGLAGKLAPKKHIIILPNEKSYPISKRSGFQEKSKAYFESEIWDACSSCGEKDNFPNCHCRPMILLDDGTLEIFPITPDNLSLIRSVADLYCQIWKEPPWNENFWKPEEVVSDILLQMANEGSVFLAAKKNSEIAGFTWGYAASRETMRQICGSQILDGFYEDGEKYFYVDELASRGHLRGKGIGKKISLALLGEARSAGQKKFILRTDIKAPAARNLYAHLGFRDLGIIDANYENRTYWIRE